MKSKIDLLKSKLEELYLRAERVVAGDDAVVATQSAGVNKCIELAKLTHASRGALVTLLGYKLICKEQDIRSHKDEYKGGFSARTFDTRVTVPFLIEKSLPRNVETHWLTQTLSFAPILNSDVKLTTVPKACGPLLVEVLNIVETGASDNEIEDMLTSILIELIHIRNNDKVVLTKPKHLSIDLVKHLLNKHFNHGYKNNSPRLPQLAVYAIYQSLIGKILRYDGQVLDKIQRMKSADRKAGTVGDVVLLQGGVPVEAVEIKFNQPITDIHVCEAIEKVRGASVSRYYLLSTAGVLSDDFEAITQRKSDFLKQNGCEIIVNGVIETIGYYLRLLPNTTEFVSNYALLVESDEDTSYEHRIAWNECCANI